MSSEPSATMTPREGEEIDVDNVPPPEAEASKVYAEGDEVDVDNPPLSPEKGSEDLDKMEEAAILDSDNEDANDVAPPVLEEKEDAAALEQEEIEPTFFSDDKGNLKFVNLVVRNPCCIFWTILIACIVISFMLIAVVFREGQPFTDPENQFDLDDVRSIQYDSLRLARDEVEEARDSLDNDAPVRRQSESGDFTYWVFEGQDEKEVFGSAGAIEAMKEAFDLFTSDAEYSEYCLLKYPSSRSNETEPYCDTPLSALTMYYASEWDSEMVAHVIEELKVPSNVELFNSLALCYTRGLYCSLLPDDIAPSDIEWAVELGTNLTTITDSWDMKGPLVQNFTQVTELASYLMQVDVYKGFVDFGYDLGFSVDNPISKYSRGILLWGSPLNIDHNGDSEDQEDQDDEDRKDYIVDNFLSDMDDLTKSGTHEELNSYYFMGALLLDILLEIVQQDAMLALASLCFVFIWIRINTGSWFLAGVGLLEIFFSIPVAWFIFAVVFQIEYFAFLNALSIFIVAAIGADDIFIFMDAYKQSKYRNPENLVSLESRMSWVYRRTGTAMAITSATTCAAFLCTLITPLAEMRSFGIFAAVVIFIDYVLVMTLFCTAVIIYHNKYEDHACCSCCCTDCSHTTPSPTEAAKEALQSGEQTDKGDRVSEFFRNRVAGFIKVPLHRAVLGVIFLCWLGVVIWQTSKIESTKEAEQFLDEDHPLQKSITILNNEFPTADDDVGLKVYYAWGLGEVDRSGVNLLFDPKNYGEPTFVETFDFNEQCQTDMIKACDKLRTDPEYAGLIKRNGGVGQVYCFLEELAAYAIKGDLSDCDYVQSGGWKDEDWQIAASDLPSLMEGFFQEQSCYEDSETILTRYGNEIGWDGQTMRYAAVAAESEVLNPFSRDPESTTRNEYDQFILIGKELEEMVSGSCTGSVIVTDLDEKFVFMNNQAIYVQTAIQSSILGVCIAFVVLFLATRVLHIALFASLSIISVLVSVTGTMVMLGWQLGSIESILIGITAGFSVDYVVHLAHAYESSPGDTYERVEAAFGDMGISVLNGMLTSIAASIPLFFCQLQFFAKFGTFLCLTIAFSWIFANFGFMSLLTQLKIPIKESGCRL